MCTCSNAGTCIWCKFKDADPAPAPIPEPDTK